MALFDWNEKLLGIPAAWRATAGENVKIAVLDSGIDLQHPCLAHLDVEGRKFDVTQAGFDPDASTLVGNDSVEDAVPFRQAHGTHCTSIIGAKPVLTDTGINGIASKADIYIIKIIDAAKESLLDYFIRGMKVAIREEVDVISISYFPIFRDPVDQAAIDAVFQTVKDKKITVVTCLENTSRLKRLNNLKFPATREASLVGGVLRKRLLNTLPANAVFNPKIDFVFPELPVTVSTLFRSRKFITKPISCSYATAALAGMVSLLIAYWKKTETNYQPRTKADIVTALHPLTLAYDKQAMLTNPLFQFYRFS